MKSEEGDDDGGMGFLAILHHSDQGSDGDKPVEGEEEEEGEEERIGNQQRQEEEEQRYQLSSIETALVIRQLPCRGLSFQLWPAASSLVSLLDQNPSLLLAALPNGGRRPPALRVLELGSGTGLVGIAAAAVLGARVTITDLPHVLPNLRFNAEANAATVAARGGSIEVRQLRWGLHEEDARELGGAGAAAFDLVLASDVVYYDHLFDPLLQTLRFFVRGEVAFVMAHLRRWKKRDAVFFRKARKLFDVTVVRTDPPLPGSRVGVAIYRFVEKGLPSGRETADSAEISESVFEVLESQV